MQKYPDKMPCRNALVKYHAIIPGKYHAEAPWSNTMKNALVEYHVEMPC
jgi:hypothetical protein